MAWAEGQQLGHWAGLGAHHIAGAGRDEFVGGIGPPAFNISTVRGPFKAWHVATGLVSAATSKACWCSDSERVPKVVKVAHVEVGCVKRADVQRVPGGTSAAHAAGGCAGFAHWDSAEKGKRFRCRTRHARISVSRLRTTGHQARCGWPPRVPWLVRFLVHPLARCPSNCQLFLGQLQANAHLAAVTTGTECHSCTKLHQSCWPSARRAGCWSSTSLYSCRMRRACSHGLMNSRAARIF